MTLSLGSLYFDHAATTPMAEEVRAFFLEQQNQFANPGSLHREGRRARALIDEARERVAGVLGVEPLGVVFTSSATEGVNTVLKGQEWSVGDRLFCSPIEHSSVLETASWLAKTQGVQVDLGTVDTMGRVRVGELADKTRLAAIQWVNQEVGTIQDLATVGPTLSIPLLVDAVQAPGVVDLSKLFTFPVHYAVFSAHKFYGPKGVGFLVAPKAFQLAPLLHGGSQEHGHRAGTENAPAIAAAALAFERVHQSWQTFRETMKALQIQAWDLLKSVYPLARLNGPSLADPQRSAVHLNVSFPGKSGEGLLLQLDFQGICVSTGSACTSGSLKPSHVLKAMGLKDEVNLATLRFSFGSGNDSSSLQTLRSAMTQALKTCDAV